MKRYNTGSLTGNRLILNRVVLVWFVVVLGIASLNPLYTDEIVYEYMLGRFFRDGWGQFFMLPECSSFHRVVPLIWQIPRSLVSGLYHILPNLLSVRALGLVIGLANCFLVLHILRRLCPKASQTSIALFALSLTVGVSPFLMILMRPEGLLVFFGLGSIALCQHMGLKRPRACAMSVCFTSALAASTHPLGVMELPIFLACLWSLRLNTKLALPFCLLAISYAVASVPLHDKWLRCDEIPSFSAFLQMYSGNSLSVNGLYEILIRLPNRIGNLFHFFGEALIPAPGYLSGIVPLQIWSKTVNYIEVGRSLIVGWITAFLTLFILSLRRFVRYGYHRNLLMSFEGSICLSILLTISALVLTQPIISPYRFTFIIPYLVLASGIMGLTSLENEHPRLFAISTGGMSFFACASCVLSLLSFIPPIVMKIDRVASEDQPHSTNHLATLHPGNVYDIAAQCKIESAPPFHRMFVDEHTYWLFRDSSEPVFFTYYGFGKAIEPLLTPEVWQKVVAADAQGLVIHCDSARRWVPNTQMRKIGELCCLNRADLELLRGQKLGKVE